MFLATLHLQDGRAGKGWVPTPAAQGTKRGLPNLKLGHLQSLFGEPPGPAKPESRLSASGALSFNFSSSTYPRPLLPPGICSPRSWSRTPSGSAANPRCRIVWQVFPRGTDGYPGRHSAHTPIPFGTPGPEPRSAAASPAVPTTLSLTAHPAPLLRTLPVTEPALPPPPSRVGAWSQEPTGRAVGAAEAGPGRS